MAAQTVLPRKDVSFGAALMLFGNTISSAIFVSVGQNVLEGRLVRLLRAIVPGVTAKQIENAGATGIYRLIPAAQRAEGVEAYNESLRVCFQVALIMACLAIFGGLGMEWRSVRKDQGTGVSKKHGDLEDVGGKSSV